MKELILMFIAPLIVMFLAMGWLFLIVKRTSRVSLSLKGLGLQISVSTESHIGRRDDTRDVITK